MHGHGPATEGQVPASVTGPVHVLAAELEEAAVLALEEAAVLALEEDAV